MIYFQFNIEYINKQLVTIANLAINFRTFYLLYSYFSFDLYPSIKGSIISIHTNGIYAIIIPTKYPHGNIGLSGSISKI